MSRPWFVSLAAIGAIGSSQPALAVTPFIENHHHPYQSGSELGPFDATTFTYVDIPGTTKTITVPSGEAVITWTLGGANPHHALVRPVIGTHAPNSTPIYDVGSGNDVHLSGAWATTIEGGTITVKLQAALSPDFPGGSFNCKPDFGTSWTLAVFPASADNAPAMSAVGLLVLVVLLLGGGAIVLASRKNATPE